MSINTAFARLKSARGNIRFIFKSCPRFEDYNKQSAVIHEGQIDLFDNWEDLI